VLKANLRKKAFTTAKQALKSGLGEKVEA